MIAEGAILDSLDLFFDEDCVFTEVADGSSRRSRAEQHAHLSGFFASLKGFNGATLHSFAAGEDTTFSEWTFDMTAGDGSAILWNEILVRKWSNEKVIEEKFYTA